MMTNQIFGIDTPSHNNPALSLIDVSQQTVVVKDFNAHFQEVEYKNFNEAGSAIEDLVSQITSNYST
jgi:hypothetical protein